MWEQCSARCLPVLADAAIKGTVVLVLAWLLVLCMRRKSAALRHAVWLVAMVCLLVLLLLSAITPRWNVLPAWCDLKVQVRAAVPGETPPSDAPGPGGDGLGDQPTRTPDLTAPRGDGLHGIAMPDRPVDSSVDHGRALSVSGEPAMEPGPGSSESRSSPARTASVVPARSAATGPGLPTEAATSAGGTLRRLLPWMGIVWLAGAAMVLAAVIRAWLSLWWVERHGKRITDRSCVELLQQSARELGLRRSVSLIGSDRCSVPLVAGVLWPRLILPEESSGWSLERRRVVVLHELAHVVRWDCLTKILVQAACGLYWFNPLVWLVLKWIQTEAERSCDDLVLSRGCDACDYAEHLLRIAAGQRRGRLAEAAGFAMARPSKLEGRLLAILDPQRNRRRLTLLGALVIGGMILSMATVIASLRASEGVPDAAGPISEQDLREAAADIRAGHAAGGKEMWDALAALVKPGMTVAQMKTVLPPARVAAGDVPGEVVLFDGASFTISYALDAEFGVEASGIAKGQGPEQMVLAAAPQIKPAKDIPGIHVRPASSNKQAPGQGRASDRERQIARLLGPFQRNPWSQWRPGTETRRQFVDDQREGFRAYTQPDLTYRIAADGKKLIRSQEVEGKPTEQVFDVSDQTGLVPSAYLHRVRKGTRVQLTIDEVQVDCLRFEDALVEHTAGGDHTTVHREWVLPSYPGIPLRRETNDDWWRVKSFRQTRRVGDRELPCVVVESHMKMHGGYAQETQYVCAEVPGHLVESVKEIHAKGTDKPLLVHERAAAIRVPDLPNWARAAAAALPGFEVVRCDHEAGVQAGPLRGYRMVLRNAEPGLTNQAQQATAATSETVTRDDTPQFVTHVELVLFRAASDLPARLAEKIPWEDLPQTWQVQAVDMGERMGFRWFARTTLYWQERLRDTLKLKGGDDRLALLAEGLYVDDKGSNTANSVMGPLKQAGEKAVPYIEAAIKRCAGDDAWKAVHSLAYIQGDRATALLKSLYASDNDEVSSAAAYALIYEPYRRAAREEYFDLLRRQKYVDRAAAACVEFQWREAIPLLQAVCDKPAKWGYYRDALKARRTLQGRPIAQAIEDAQAAIVETAHLPSPTDAETIAQAKRVLLDSSDTEAVTITAIGLATFDTKANKEQVDRVRQAGRDILRELPADDIRTLLRTLVDGMKAQGQDEGYWRECADLLHWLEAADPDSSQSSDGRTEGDAAAQWHRAGKTDLAAVDAERALYEKAGQRHFFVHVRITNVSDRPIGVDLRDYAKVVYANQWGRSETDHRLVIDEQRIVHRELAEADRKKLVADFAAGKLTTIAPGRSIGYYRDFNASGRADVDRSQGKYLIVSLDGELLLTDGTKVQQFSCDWDHGSTVEQTALVIPAPVPWKTIPADGWIVWDLYEQLLHVKAEFETILPQDMTVTRSRIEQLATGAGLLFQASPADGAKAHPSFALFLWPRSNPGRCPYESRAGAHTFVGVGSSGDYIVFYAGPEDDLKARVTKAFCTDAGAPASKKAEGQPAKAMDTLSAPSERERKRREEEAAQRAAAEKNEDEHYRALYGNFKAQILDAVKAGNKNEVARLTAQFNQSLGGRLLYMRVTRIDDYVRVGAADAPGKMTTLIDKPLGGRQIALPNIHYAFSPKPHVTRQTDDGRTYILVETNRLEGGTYADDVFITMAIDTRDPEAWSKGPAAVRRVIAMLEKPWQEKLSDRQLDAAADSIRPMADEAVDEIMRAFNRSGQAFAYRHRAVQILERLGTEKARATLLEIALGRSAEDLPSMKQWASAAYIRTMKDKAEVRRLLVSDDSGVLNNALLAIKGIEIDETLLQRLLELIAWKDKEPVSQMAIRHAAAAVMAADPAGKFVPQKVDAVLAAVADVANMPDAGKVYWPGYYTHAEASYHQYMNCLGQMKGADEVLRQATGRAAGVAREILIIARAHRGDAAARQDIHRILEDQQAGIRRAWAARALAVVGTREDLPILKKVAASDPLEREQGGDVGPPDGRKSTFFPVREAAKEAIRTIEDKAEERPVGPAPQSATGKESFETLTVEKTSTWRWDRTLTVRGNGTYAFRLELLDENHSPSGKQYVASYRLRTEHLRRLEEVLRATDWLARPGKVDPHLEDGTKYVLSLDRGGRNTRTVCYGDQEQAYKDLLRFLTRIDSQEWLLYQMLPDAGYRSNPVAQLEDELDAVLGTRPGKTPPYAPVLDYERLLPALESLLERATPKEQTEIRDVIRKIGEWRKVAADAPWGEAVRGVRVRLRVDKTAWSTREAPVVKVDLRNDGNEEFFLIGYMKTHCYAHIDDLVYLGCPGIPGGLRPKDTFTAIPVKLTGSRQVADSFRRFPLATNPDEGRLELEPGKHVVWVSFRMTPRGAPDKAPQVEVFSNPVEITIVSDGEGHTDDRAADEPGGMPGRQMSLQEAVNRWAAFAVACEATDEPERMYVSGMHDTTVMRQQYRPVSVLAGKHAPRGQCFLSYVVKGDPPHLGRPIRKGERVIWIGDNPSPDAYRGVKAVADTPENREAVRTAFAKRPASADKYVAFPERADAEEAARRVALLKRKLDAFRLVFRPMLQPGKPVRFLALRVAGGEDTSDWEKPAIQITQQQATRIIDHLAAEGLFFRRAGDVVRDTAFVPDTAVDALWLIDNENNPQSVLVEELQYGDTRRLNALRNVLEGEAQATLDRLLGRLESNGHQEDKEANGPKAQDAVPETSRTPLSKDTAQLRTSPSPLKLLASDVKYEGEGLQRPPNDGNGRKIVGNVAYYRSVMTNGLVGEDLATKAARAYRMFDLAIAAGWYERKDDRHLPQDIRGLYRQGTKLWMGSNGVGILVYDTKAKTWSRHSIQQAPVPGFHVTVLHGDGDYVFANYGYSQAVPGAVPSLHVYSAKHAAWLRITAIPRRDALRLGTSETLLVARGWNHRRFAEEPLVPIGGEDTPELAYPNSITRRPDGSYLLRSGDPNIESSWTDLIVRPDDLRVAFERFAPMPWTDSVASPATTEITASLHQSPSYSLTKTWANKDLAHQSEAQGLFVRDGAIYFGAGGSGRKIAKVRAADGAILWSHATGSTYQPSYPVANGTVVIYGTYYDPARLVGLDDKTGAERWTIPTGGQNMSAATFADELAFIGSYDLHVYAIDWAKGVVRWQTRLGAPVWCRPAVVGDRVLVACYDGFLYGLDKASGEVLTRVDCGGRLESDLLVAGGLLFLLADDQKYGEKYDSSKQQRAMVAIDLARDKIVSRIPSDTPIQKKLVVSGGEVYFFDYATLYCYDTKARQLAWKFQPSNGLAPYPLVYDSVIVLPMNYCGREGQHTPRVVTLARDAGKVLSRAETGGLGVYGMPNCFFSQLEDVLIVTSNRGAEAYQVSTSTPEAKQ